MTKQRKPARSSNPSRQSGLSAAKRTKTAKTAQVPAPAMPVRQSKKASILALLQRPQGAAIGDLTEATGWQNRIACVPL